MTRIIRRYANRKYYDVNESRYVILDEIYSFVRNGQDVTIFDSAAKDITAATLFRILVDRAEKISNNFNCDLLKSVIKQGDGSLHDFIKQNKENRK